MDVRNNLIIKRYTESSLNGNEILINDRPYGVTNKLRNRLKLRNILVYIEIIILAIIFKDFYKKGLGFKNRYLNIGMFFIISLVLAYLISRLVISKKIVEEEVTPINRMYR